MCELGTFHKLVFSKDQAVIHTIDLKVIHFTGLYLGISFEKGLPTICRGFFFS